jgi:colanic acid biosynthesis glycosyl transferase WcaI
MNAKVKFYYYENGSEHQTLAKILFLVSNFPPEISTGRLEHELSQSLVRGGNSVTVVTAFPRRYLVNHLKPHGGKFLYKEEIDGIKIIRMGPEFSSRDNIITRGFEYFFESFSFLIGALFSGKTDVIICSSPPLTLALAGFFLGKVKHAPVIVRIGDLHPQELIDLGLIKSKSLVRLLEMIEKFVYRKIDFFTVLSAGYQEHLLKKGTAPNKVRVVPNWGNTEEIENSKELRRDFGVPTHKFTLTYAGIMSWFQDLETIVDAASQLREYKDIHFLLVGDGSQKRFLEEKATRLQLDNISFVPLQLRTEYLRILQASDVCFVSLKKEIKTTTLPSKLLDILACGRPVIANVPCGEVSDIIFRAKCGVWVEPQNPDELVRAILTLYRKQAELRQFGQNAREYMEKHFSLNACATEYEKIIQKAMASCN